MEASSGIEKAMSMDKDTWRRHANPWSVYTRFLSLPLLGIALWSRDWIGTWFVAPVAIALLWVWINPRLFPVPSSTDNWASKGVLGERIWLRRKTVPISRHHTVASMILAGASAIGALQFAYGVIALDAFMASYGMIVTILTKAWFIDRMVWLFEDMMHTSAEYRDWLY